MKNSPHSADIEKNSEGVISQFWIFRQIYYKQKFS